MNLKKDTMTLENGKGALMQKFPYQKDIFFTTEKSYTLY